MTLTKTVQDALVGYLQTVPGLTEVPILGRREKDIANDITAATNRLGACIYVFPPLPRGINRENPGPYVTNMEVRVRVYEDPAVPVPHPDAYEIVEHCLRALHHLCLDAIPGGNPLLLDENPVIDVEDPIVAFDITGSFGTGYPPLS